jgi:hypothetical protein
MPNTINNRAPTYSIVFALHRCVHCMELTPVVGVVLPVGHETLAADAVRLDGAFDKDVWETTDAEAVLFLIEYLPETVVSRLRELSEFFRLDYNEKSEQSYWLNYCSHCGLKQEDCELYCEPEGAFLPISEVAAASILLHDVREPFEARAAGYAYAPQFFDYVERSESRELEDSPTAR